MITLYSYWVVEVIIMDSCMVKIHRVFKEGITGRNKTEIWARFYDKNSNETKQSLIWWEDDEGIFHDETPNLPFHLRNLVDNAWIEQSRQW